eukprot:6190735-Pleurochrysis_carterae.AAC.3
MDVIAKLSSTRASISIGSAVDMVRTERAQLKRRSSFVSLWASEDRALTSRRALCHRALAGRLGPLALSCMRRRPKRGPVSYDLTHAHGGTATGSAPVAVGSGDYDDQDVRSSLLYVRVRTHDTQRTVLPTKFAIITATWARVHGPRNPIIANQEAYLNTSHFRTTFRLPLRIRSCQEQEHPTRSSAMLVNAMCARDSLWCRAGVHCNGHTMDARAWGKSSMNCSRAEQPSTPFAAASA